MAARPVSISEFQNLQRGDADDPFAPDPAAMDAEATAVLRRIGSGATDTQDANSHAHIGVRSDENPEDDSTATSAVFGDAQSVDEGDAIAAELVAARLQALDVSATCTAEMSLSMVVERVRRAAYLDDLEGLATDAQIVAEAERIVASFSDNRRGPSRDPFAQMAVDEMARTLVATKGADPEDARIAAEVVVDTIQEERAERLAQTLDRAGRAASATPDWRQIATTRAAGDLAVTTDESGVVVDARPAEMTPDRGDVTRHHTVTDDDGQRWSGAGAADKPASEQIEGYAPWMELRVPTEAEFGDDEFYAAAALAHRAEILIKRHRTQFRPLSDLNVVFLWKKTGGKSKGRGIFGKATKPSGLLKHFSGATFVVWLAADHCRASNYSERQIEALLFHEMCHLDLAEADPDTGRGGGPTLVPHDVEMFRAEVEVYGLWAADLRDVAPAFRQGHLFDGSAERSGSVVVNGNDDGAGILIHDDGTPMTAEEIAAMEARELADDDLGCEACGGTGGQYTHAANCDSEFCVGNGDAHSCSGSWGPCDCNDTPPSDDLADPDEDYDDAIVDGAYAEGEEIAELREPRPRCQSCGRAYEDALFSGPGLCPACEEPADLTDLPI